MSKKMSMTYTGSFAKAKHNKEIEFYSSFIKAIEGNSEMIINKRNCIDNLEKVRDEMNEKMNAIMDPIREKRHFYEEHKDMVRDSISEGTKKANEIGNRNIAEIKEKMHVII